MNAWRRKFSDAGRGLLVAWRGHSSFRVHLFAVITAFSLAFTLRLEAWRWAILMCTVTAVIVAELVNTSIEHLAKAITRHEHPEIKSALDVAAAAVLTTAIAAIMIGIWVFAPALVNWTSH